MTQPQTPIPVESLIPKTHSIKEVMPALTGIGAAVNEVTSLCQVLRGLPDSALQQSLPHVWSMVDHLEKRMSLMTPTRTISAEEPGAAMLDAETVHTRDTDTSWTLRAWARRWDDPQLRPFLGMYLAIFEARIVATGESRADVRNKAFQALNGTVPHDRFVIDYWTDEE